MEFTVLEFPTGIHAFSDEESQDLAIGIGKFMRKRMLVHAAPDSYKASGYRRTGNFQRNISVTAIVRRDHITVSVGPDEQRVPYAGFLDEGTGLFGRFRTFVVARHKTKWGHPGMMHFEVGSLKHRRTTRGKKKTDTGYVVWTPWTRGYEGKDYIYETEIDPLIPKEVDRLMSKLLEKRAAMSSTIFDSSIR